jgi:hypothetical protein
VAWTTPRTWVASEVVTAALLNTHLRDNDAYLKAVLDGTASQAVHFLSTLEVDGLTTIHGNLETFGTLIAQDNISGAGMLTITPPGGGGSSSGVDNSGNLYTQAGDLDIAGDGVIDGTLSVSGRPVRAGGARVYHNANQSIANNTLTALALNQERYDDAAFHDTVTNNSRLTIPAGMGGKYSITGHVDWAANADANERSVAIRLNGTIYIAFQSVPSINSASVSTRLSVATIYELAATDYVELVVRQQSGGALNLLASVNFSPEFAIAAL